MTDTAAASRLNRRALLGAGLATGASLSPAVAAPKGRETEPAATGLMVPAGAFRLEPNGAADQSERLQAAIDQTSAKGLVLALPGGRYICGNVVLRPGTRIVGAAGATVLVYSGAGTLLQAPDATDIRLEGLTLDGRTLVLDRRRTSALIALADGRGVHLAELTVTGSSANGIALTRIGGIVRDCTLSAATEAALLSLDAAGLEIASNTVAHCADNGILVWRSTVGPDGTLVTANRIRAIANRSGGSGQFGNGINIYRAGNVIVAGNTVENCAYSAVRANSASNVQMTGNTVRGMGEVALYAEFGFEGALIASNIVDTAATGIAVTNFKEGGRLAVVQGNIVRNLFRREHEATDKRGEGIGIEADAVVANNVVEGAPTAGIAIGWGRYMREVVATGNLIRKSRIGIAVTGDPTAGACLIANNMVSGASDGAVRTMDFSRAVGADLAAGKGPRNIAVTGTVVS